MKPSQIVLGTDSPHGGMTAGCMVEYMKALLCLPIPTESLQAILGGNASRLLKLRDA